MTSMHTSSTIDGENFQCLNFFFLSKTILEFKKKNIGQICIAKSVQYLNDAIFKNY